MKLSAILAPLVAAKVPHEVILETVRAYEAQQEDALERRRANDRERQQRRRHVTSRDVTVTPRDGCDAPSDKEAPQTPKEINSPRSDPKGSSLTPRAALETVLDAERAQAVVAHRQRIGKALTPYAAKLLAGKFAKAPDPNAAADTMIANGWQGFEPEWLESRSSRQSTAPPQPERTVSDVLGEIAAGTWAGPQDRSHEPDFLTIDASFSRRN